MRPYIPRSVLIDVKVPIDVKNERHKSHVRRNLVTTNSYCEFVKIQF